MDSYISLPMPGQPKTVSTKTDPVNRKPMSTPMMRHHGHQGIGHHVVADHVFFSEPFGARHRDKSS